MTVRGTTGFNCKHWSSISNSRNGDTAQGLISQAILRRIK